MSTLLSFKRLNAWCTRVIDGDTVELDVYFPVRKKVRLVETVVVRILGIDSAEIRDKDPEKRAKAKAAKEFLRVVIEHCDCQVELVNPDKYGGRWDGKVYQGSASLADVMIQVGHAVPYSGGKRDAGTS